MKRIVPISGIIATVAIVASCGVPSSREIAAEKLGVSTVVLQDTAGMSEYKAFQDWKSQKELDEYKAFVNGEDKNGSSSIAGTASNKSSGSAKRNTVYYPSSNTSSTPQSQPATSQSQPVEEKKGWSKAAKGAAIGAGGGAVVGAVVNKRNRAVGAAIGGVLGGGVGYGIGRHMDKKDGRY
ncbi:MAG: YMGG-like glycine zipper-containing protein [Flavitalea sp.]